VPRPCSPRSATTVRGSCRVSTSIPGRRRACAPRVQEAARGHGSQGLQHAPAPGARHTRCPPAPHQPVGPRGLPAGARPRLRACPRDWHPLPCLVSRALDLLAEAQGDAPPPHRAARQFTSRRVDQEAA
jgi:hypothetical protein